VDDLHERESAGREKLLAAQVSLLDGEMSQAEYRRRRAALPVLVVDPTCDLGDCSQRDYRLRREIANRPPVPEDERVAGFSFEQYQDEREGQR
jgi:hypothetical protein